MTLKTIAFIQDYILQGRRPSIAEALLIRYYRSGPLGPVTQKDTISNAKHEKREGGDEWRLYFCFLYWRGCRESCFLGWLDRDKKTLLFFKKLLTIQRSYIRAEDIGTFL